MNIACQGATSRGTDLIVTVSRPYLYILGASDALAGHDQMVEVARVTEHRA
jgi:hypothetical protein